MHLVRNVMPEIRKCFGFKNPNKSIHTHYEHFTGKKLQSGDPER